MDIAKEWYLNPKSRHRNLFRQIVIGQDTEPHDSQIFFWIDT